MPLLQNILQAVAVAALFTLATFAKAGGTGFFISSDGLLVTNHHVIAGAESVRVRTPDGTVKTAKVLASDRHNDLAVLKVATARPVAFLRIRHSETVVRGIRVLAIGYPLTSIQGFEAKVTDGIVSSLSGLQDDPRMLQITNAIQPGNSGGPLLGQDGTVVGVVTARLAEDVVKRETGTTPQSVNYAVKSSYLVELLGASTLRGRVRVLRTALGAIQSEEIVRRAENAVVMIQTSPREEASVPVAPTAPPVERASCPSVSPFDANRQEFANVTFWRKDASLEVWAVNTFDRRYSSTLQPGDEIVACQSRRQVPICHAADIARCTERDSGGASTAGALYMLAVRRNGEEVIASVLLRRSSDR